MEKQDILKNADVAHCPICNANAVQPCQEPQKDDCPRGEAKK